MKILNMTQHPATPEQRAAGVIDPRPCEREAIISLLTVDQLPTPGEIEARCADLALIASMYDYEGHDMDEGEHPTHAMIGGAPWMMAALESALLDAYITPLYAFSVRESVEITQPNGSVVKTNVFNHAGFVPAI